jgi:hypothetical protein
MKTFLEELNSYNTNPIYILDKEIPFQKYVPLDLSKSNIELTTIDITDYNLCQKYIDKVLHKKNGVIAYGGYLEERNLYSDKEGFTSNLKSVRNIHLGIDYWCKASTKVIVPLNGEVHSFKNNAIVGDYGPTVILKHVLNNYTFYTLYGHLSIDSLEGLFVGRKFKSGDTLGSLGTPDINVNYAPHLHFQIIRNLGHNQGDYPGVCAKEHLPFYKENCPDPDILLKLTALGNQ